MRDTGRTCLTRRSALGGSLAMLGSGALSSNALSQTPKFRRWEITDPAMPPRVVASYKAGITRMLALPPTDPRNWYRNAFVHILDCPHGNWWFLAWHRAYLGWFEATVRELSGDAEFALPYWDWTKAPRVPAVMFEDVLDPNNGAFIGTFAAFKAAFEPAVATMFSSFSPAQTAHLTARGIGTVQNLWSSLEGSFVNRPSARGLTATNPDLDPNTRLAVGPAKIRRALRTELFAGSGVPGQPAGFQSGKSANHRVASIQGILESEPHNNVHGGLAGGGVAFMSAYLSPVDPIFFLHHANLDRLWDVWARRQAARSRAALPQGADLALWSDEPFLFFTDPRGQPVTKVKAGEYSTMTTFDYDYAPGSGENEVPSTGPVVTPAPPQAFSGVITESLVGAPTAAGAVVPVPAAALRAQPDTPSPVAEVTLNLTHADEGRRFRVLVSPGGGAAPVAAGTITVFGHAGHRPTTFSIALPEDLAAPGTAGNVPLDIRVVPIGPATPLPGPGAAPPPAGFVMPPPQVSAIRVLTD